MQVTGAGVGTGHPHDRSGRRARSDSNSRTESPERPEPFEDVSRVAQPMGIHFAERVHRMRSALPSSVVVARYREIADDCDEASPTLGP